MMFSQLNANLIKNKIGSSLIVFNIIVLCASISSINSDSLMNGTQTGKTMVFLWGILLLTGLVLLQFGLSLRSVKPKFSLIDSFIPAFVLYILFLNNWLELEKSLLFLELTGLVVFYFILRQQSNQALRWILIGLSIGGLIQAIYGNLQLWGYFPSHHGIFKMTGSFFNPGPYSGYLAAVFPISLGLYLFNVSSRKQNIFILKLDQYVSNLLSLFERLKTRSHLFYNNNEEKSSPEEQKGSIKLTDYITMKSFFSISMISMCLVLPASRSRAAWLAVAVSSIYLLSIKYRLVQQAKAHFNSRVRRVSLLVSLVVLLFIVGAGLYHFKKGSADGRLLIWKVSIEMIKDKPLLGHGYDGFKKHYMDYQAEYFENNPDSQEAFVAGDTNYAFNELIQLTVEYGLVGLLLVLLVIIRIFSNSSNREASNPSNSFYSIKSFYRSKATTETLQTLKPSNLQLLPLPDIDVPATISRAVILSIMVFSLFSYPLQILPIKICLVVALAIVAGKRNHKEKSNSHESIHISNPRRFVLKSILAMGCLGLLWLAIGHLTQLKKAHTDWKNAFYLYNMGIYNECLTDYARAYPALKTNGDFLTNYGKALSMAEQHDNAAGVLQQASHYYPNTVVYTAMGDSYKKLGQTTNAEQAYLHAWHMNPSRFYPKYLLAKLYDESGQNERAVVVAKELLSKDIKIESTAIQEMRDEMKRIIE